VGRINISFDLILEALTGTCCFPTRGEQQLCQSTTQ
jgi:hypothetical protein